MIPSEFRNERKTRLLVASLYDLRSSGATIDTKAEDYRRKAEGAEAARTQDYAAKQTSLDIARQWCEMAAIGERLNW